MRARIHEDYLRILRFFRFHAQYGDPAQGLDADALDACARGAQGMGQLSAERIGAEMRKLLAAPDPAPAVAAMAQCGVLGQVLPGAQVDALARLIHLEGNLPPRWLRRLLVLGGKIDRLRLTRSEARHLKQAQASIASLQGPVELGYRLGAEAGGDVLLARAALLESPCPPTGRRICCAAQVLFFPCAPLICRIWTGLPLARNSRCWNSAGWRPTCSFRARTCWPDWPISLPAPICMKSERGAACCKKSKQTRHSPHNTRQMARNGWRG